MARLHSSLGDRTVFTPDGLALAQKAPVSVYEDEQCTVLANLAAYDPNNADEPGTAIPDAAMKVDAWSNRPKFWDLNDRDLLYVVVDGGPAEPIRPDAQPQVTALATRVTTVEGVAAAAETQAGAQAKAGAAQAAAEATAAAGLAAHTADTTAVHGIADTAALVVTTDPRFLRGLPYRRSRTIALGDSIDAGSDTADSYSAGSIFNAITVASGQRVAWLRNSGVPGNTTAQCLARVNTDVIAYSPDVCIIGGGVTNDHSSGVAEATTRANLQSIAEACEAARIAVVVRTVPPCDSAGSFASIALRRAAITRHNAWVTGWARQRGYPVFDYYGPLVDDTTGGYIASYTSDGIHPNTAGINAAGAAVVESLSASWSGLPLLVQSVTTGGMDMFSGVGLFLGVEAAGIAAGWTASGNDATADVIPAAGIPGNWQTVTGGSSSIKVIETAVLTTGFSVGDLLYFAARVQRSGGASAQVRLRLGTPSSYTNEINPGAGTRSLDGIIAGYITVPSGITRLKMEITVNAGETLQVAQMTTVNLTTLG